MRIRQVECDQFAGLTNKEIEFDKGMNIVIGDNESGKSTLIDLIYQLLFKDAKIDGRSDLDFIDKYFPKKISGPQGDVIDGVIIFDTPTGTYKLKKEWEKGEGTCRLTLPNGTSIKGNAEINKILNEELKHRAGVYSEIVFASQKRKQIAIESIMESFGKKTDPLSDTRSDLASTLTQAALETGGVAIDKLEKTITKNMDDLIGRWDWGADAPEGGPKRASYNNPWSQGAGSIVKAYYAVDEVRSKQIDAENAERVVESAKSGIQVLQVKKKEVETERTDFQKYREVLGQRSLLVGLITDLNARLNENSEAYEKWPGIRSNIEKAKELQRKQELARIRALYLKAEPIQKEFLEKKTYFEKLKEVDNSDIKKLSELITKKQQEEAKLTGMNLVAKIKEIHLADVKVTAVASGEVLDLSTGEVQITEAVDINIPGVLDMQLVPQGVDVEDVNKKIENYRAEIKELLEKYQVDSLEKLKENSEEYKELKRQVDQLKLDIDRMLGDQSWEDLKAANDAVPEEIETEADIKNRINELCGSKSVDAFIGGLESTLLNYKEKYLSIDNLKGSIEKLKKDKDDKQKTLDSIGDIPEEYQGIDNPDNYDEELSKKIEDFEEQIEGYRKKLSEAERNLGDKSAEEYLDDLQDKESVFLGLKLEYQHWRSIYNAFCKLKDQTKDNPIDKIESNFREYLRVITDGTLLLNSIDDQMLVQLASGSNALTYNTLSDGTKDTISLAFRLAMLEHLYPEGDGLAVFDDPFTDMDVKRVEQSCKLIQKFAENNQVIFTTCDDKYTKYMTGNVITMCR
ncbi:DNA repair exonuclease SbcCD ATPase subunit [Eubacterium ruminantium]|nr:DNA repair exonuclease SbcCD ATPase subunit [Eubacterium ruminantium]